MYRDLLVWQRSMELVEAIYRLSSQLPAEEKFGLVTQLRRASVSIPSNIAEGHERRSRADYRRFIAIACGSLAEVETQLYIAERLHASDIAHCMNLAAETGKMLRAIERKLRAPAAMDQSSAASPQP